jgi:hypothetical protein
MRRLTLLGAVLVAIAAVSIGGIFGCSEEKGALVPNILPGIELTATPPAGDTTRYDIEFHWTGWDADGEVDYFEYVIDPPLEVVTNPRGFVDTLTWTRTDAYSGRFTFRAPAYDTLTIDDWRRDYRLPQIGLGYHLFAIRAVDDMGARSIVNDSSWVAFTAATICPKTRLTSPPAQAADGTFGQAPQPVGLRVTFRWDGEDADGIFNDKPIRYMYKLVDVTALGRLDDDVINAVNAEEHPVTGEPQPWILLDPGVVRITLGLDDGHRFGFGVKAIDEASSIEPLLVPNRNLYFLGASQQSSYPTLRVSSVAFGSRTWSGWTIDTEEYEVPLGSLYEFTLTADANLYGGLITGFSYGWNLPDVEITDTNPTGDRAWTPWSTSRTIVPAQFTVAQDQYLYIKCKDDGGAVTLATIKFNVVTLNPEKELAYIDDWRWYPQFPSPGARFGEPFDDAFWQEMLRGYDYGDGWDELVWDEWTAPFDEAMPSLRFLSRFKVLVWSINDNRQLGADQKSAFYEMSKTNTVNVLAVYLGSESSAGVKGKVWLTARGMVESCVLPHGGTNCGYPYSVNVQAQLEGCAIRPRDFAYDFLHLRGQFNRNETNPSGASVNYFNGSSDGVTYVSFDEVGPTLTDGDYVHDPAVNPGPYSNFPRRLDPNTAKPKAGTFLTWEVLQYPKPNAPSQVLFYDPILDRQTGLCPLYRFRARSQLSKADNLYCAFRYIPRGPSDHGEIVYNLFSMYPFYDDQSRQYAKAVLTDLFGLPDPDALGYSGAAPAH